jgi:hypothetical protein
MAYAIDDATKEKIQVDPATDTYTKAETNELLGSKANTSHTHNKSQITDFAHTHNDIYYTKNENNVYFMLPVGHVIMRRTAANNGGMPYGSWGYIGQLETQDEQGQFVYLLLYQRVG